MISFLKYLENGNAYPVCHMVCFAPFQALASSQHLHLEAVVLDNFGRSLLVVACST